jgi:predicted MFS family arabinose efflux permease
MRLWRSIHELGRSRRAVVLTPLIIALVAVLLWTLEHTDIVAFATIFVAALVLVSGTFWVTGRATSREIALGEQQSQIVNRLFHPSVGGR